jgi:hypothetical protein
MSDPKTLNEGKKMSNTFNLIFGTVVGFTVISGMTAVGIASQPQLTSQQEQVFETCKTTWQTGIGAVVGLMGSNLLQEKKGKQDKEGDKSNN